ncbi:hypothetical protein [Thermodesulfatator autotrophicus]|uniref:Uncharacterized protein n=1 Tax=Thermodesulfatator autotrophicus TaxID=1795632 RepID=A0A177E827_9BACT|nr:hypothetical protein [Thermodesulfatator autotrophicus]OAG28113.1 hypothetical protein TH606_03515 [Thermodesulfatator autotrophicus]
MINEATLKELFRQPEGYLRQKRIVGEIVERPLPRYFQITILVKRGGSSLMKSQKLSKNNMEKIPLGTISLLASLLEEDLHRNWRHIFTVINELKWQPFKRERVLKEPETENPTVKAICASLAEWLCRKEGVSPPSWAVNTGPSPKAVYFVPLSAHSIVKGAIIFFQLILEKGFYSGTGRK